MAPLAIEGGAPVRGEMLPYTQHSIEQEDIAAVVAAMESGWLTTGPVLVEFEEAFAARVEAAHAVAFSSGTAALHGAAHVSGIGPGDEAIVTPLSFVATANCVRYVGGRVVFADIASETLLLDPEQVAAAITPRSRAIVTVDFAGLPSELGPLRELAKRHGVTLIEDAAHSLGATYGGRQVGALADLTVFSLHPAKHVAAGEGGVVTTNDPEAAGRLRRFRNHGISATFRQRHAAGTWEYEVVEQGYNYRLSELHAALALSQLRRLDDSVRRRREIAQCYANALSGVAGLELPPTRAGRESSWHLYPVRLDLERLRVGRREVYEALRAENIGVNVHYVPIPRHPIYRDATPPKSCPVAEREYERLVSLPLFPGMSAGDVDDVVEAVQKVLAAYRAN